jgi:polyhydroxybutyrate depolymerase
VALAAVLLMLGGCTDDTPDADVPFPGHHQAKLRVGDRERGYSFYRPVSAPPSAPLVVVLHGAGGSGRQAEAAYGWDRLADEEGFVVAYPEGVNRSWNAAPACCGTAARDGVDDVGFLTALVSAVPGADPGRVFATGISDGAMMTYRLACDTKLFAAIGPVAGTMVNRCDSPSPVSLIHVHGTQDLTIPYAGGPGRRTSDSTGRLPTRVDGPAVPALVGRWRAVDGCTNPVEATSGAVTVSKATCQGDRAVELVTVEGAGHQWPGGAPAPAQVNRVLGLDPPFPGLDATAVLWAFFASASR